MESNKSQTVKKGLGWKTEINNELESDNISTQQTTKVYLHNEQDHIEGDNKPEKEGFNELIVCKICQKRFCSEEELNNHHKQPALRKNYKCCACKQPHRDSSSLNVHIRKHTGERPYVCEVCSKEFKRNDHLKRHMKTHTGERQYECFDCGRKFIQLQGLSRHLAVHTNHTPYKCFICNKQFKREEALKRHRRIHYHYKNKTKSAESEDMARGFKCDICSTVCLSRWDLKRHQMVHNNENESDMKIHTSEKPFSCDTCKRSFHWSENLMRRIGKVYVFVCAICKTTFTRKGSLDRHMNMHSRKPFSCDTCKKALSLKNHLSNICGKNVAHSTSVKDRVVFVCAKCKRTYFRKDSLNRHMKIHHRKPFPCDTCRKALNLKIHLNNICGKNLEHSSSVKDRVVFMCTKCKRTYSRKDSLKRHMKIHHRKPFPCDTCKKVLNLKIDLNNICGKNLEHISSVKNRVLFVCTKCKRMYSRKDSLSRHMKVHNEKNIIMKLEPEEPRIVEVKMKQEEHYEIGDARKLDPNGQTITGHEENNNFMKVDPEEPQIIEQERVYPQIVYEI